MKRRYSDAQSLTLSGYRQALAKPQPNSAGYDKGRLNENESRVRALARDYVCDARDRARNRDMQVFAGYCFSRPRNASAIRRLQAMSRSTLLRAERRIPSPTYVMTVRRSADFDYF